MKWAGGPLTAFSSSLIFLNTLEPLQTQCPTGEALTGLQSRVPDAVPAPGRASSQPHVLRIRKTEARRLGACQGPTAANTDPNKRRVHRSHLNAESPATCPTLDKTF